MVVPFPANPTRPPGEPTNALTGAGHRVPASIGATSDDIAPAAARARLMELEALRIVAEALECYEQALRSLIGESQIDLVRVRQLQARGALFARVSSTATSSDGPKDARA